MNHQEPTEKERVLNSVNLEEYNKLLCELDQLEENQLSQKEITIRLKIPEVIAETIKLFATFFHRTTIDEYLQHCVFSTLTGDFDRLLRHHTYYEKLFGLIEKIGKDGKEND